MRIRQSFIAVLAAVLILSGCPFAFAAKADYLPEKTNEIPVFDETAPQTEAAAETETASAIKENTDTAKKDTNAAEEPSGSTEKSSDAAKEDTRAAEEPSGNTEKNSDIMEEDTDTAEEDTNAAEEPSGGAEKNTDTMEEDTDTAEEPSGGTEKSSDAAEEDTDTAEEPSGSTEKNSDAAEEDTCAAEEPSGSTEEESKMPESEEDTEPQIETDFPLPEKAPAFHAHIEFRMGYTVIGTFKDFTPDIVRIQTLYSLDGENWQIGTENWNLYNLDTDDEYLLNGLQNQSCLFNLHEPLKSYIAGKIDRFYLKLRITKQNGLSYDTQSAMIERDGLQQIPEGTRCSALFSSSIAVRESDPTAPYRYRKYGRYQLTISEDATAEEISALLPDTLPVEIQLDHGPDFIAIGVIDCPVTWKPLSLPSLSAGESITILDAAEEIVVPNGTLVSTPLGIFQLETPLSLNNPPSTDEVRLVLNVIQKGENPTGVLRAGKNGLEMAFHHNATGAASIQAYVLAEGESTWTKLSGLSLMEELNQPSTANSGYGLVLRNDQEPYQSYVAATNAGETPTPFFIGLIIEGGIYDGREFILPWPDIYEELPALPKIRGAEGNEGNVGADNKEDSTAGGQRPNLPQQSDDNTEKQLPVPPQAANNEHEEPSADPPQTANNNHEEPSADPPPKTENDSWEQPWISAPVPDNSSANRQIPPSPIPETDSAIPEDQNIFFADEPVSGPPSESPGNQSLTGQRPYLPQAEPDNADTSAANDEDSLVFASSVIQPLEDVKEEEHTPILPDTRIAGPMPLFLMAAAAVLGVCFGVAVLKATDYNLVHRLAKKIRIILGK